MRPRPAGSNTAALVAGVTDATAGGGDGGAAGGVRLASTLPATPPGRPLDPAKNGAPAPRPPLPAQVKSSARLAFWAADNASISQLIVGAGHRAVRRFNDTSHLTRAARNPP
ncbi:MAG: hypothetical protein M3063_10970 [Actinomycetota bacterium]|nr:hypothetical protein [Actinomycetota bacterium]